MIDLPFDLVDESKLSAETLEVLARATGQMKDIMSQANGNFIDPDIDATFKHIIPAVDGDYLAFHRVRLQTANAPMAIYTYLTFFGDCKALAERGYDPLDLHCGFQLIEPRKGFEVLHILCPIFALFPEVQDSLLMRDWSNLLHTTTTPFQLSSAEDTDPLSTFETNLMIELN